MQWFDRIFVAIFARYRRRKGGDIERAWRAADYQVGSYLTLPLAFLGGVVFFSLWPVHGSMSADQRRCAQIVGAALALAMYFVLQRRFSKFLSSPPPLDVQESETEARLIRIFRIATIGVFIVGCALAAVVGFHRNAS